MEVLMASVDQLQEKVGLLSDSIDAMKARVSEDVQALRDQIGQVAPSVDDAVIDAVNARLDSLKAAVDAVDPDPSLPSEAPAPEAPASDVPATDVPATDVPPSAVGSQDGEPAPAPPVEAPVEVPAPADEPTDAPITAPADVPAPDAPADAPATGDEADQVPGPEDAAGPDVKPA
jgi:hypothetical protein